MKRLSVIRLFIFLATTVGAWGILSLGGSESNLLVAGQVAARTYNARISAEVEDEEATNALRQQAAAAVPDERRQDENAEEAAFSELNEVLEVVAAGALDPAAPVPLLVPPDQVPATTIATTATETTEAPVIEQVTVTGRLFLDVDGDAVFTEAVEGQRPDSGIRSVNIRLYDANGAETATTESQGDGTWSTQVPAGLLSVAVDPGDVDFPSHMTLSTDNALQTIECDEGTCDTAAVGYRTAVRPLEAQVADLTVDYRLLQPSTLQNLAAYATEDVVRMAMGESLVLATVGDGARLKLTEVFGAQVTTENVSQVRDDLFSQPPIVLIGGTPNDAARTVAADLVAMVVRPNYVFDPQATEAARLAAEEAVEPVMMSFQAQQLIIAQGQV
ncbi:MAG: hypothetical protein ACRDWH_08560, partial [Acidimicrobiia bacterium]